MVMDRVFPLLLTLRRKSLARRLLICPTELPEEFAVVTNEPLPRPLLVTPARVVCASKLKNQIDLMLTGPPLPASEQLCAKGCAALSMALVTASKRGTSRF